MEWINFNCSNCDSGLLCYRPNLYSKPILCLHSSIKNLTDFLRVGQTTTTTTTTTEAATMLKCETNLSTLIVICRCSLQCCFLHRLAVHFGMKLRHALANRAFKKQMLRRHSQRMNSNRRLRAGQMPPPLVLPEMLANISLRPTGTNLTGQVTVQKEEPVYDMPPSAIEVHLENEDEGKC
uniref:Uncharacterized protein n=1 Tax=Globodera rostochiensis TaxID=31243 RepID=A0A914HAS1_GLORO